MRERHRQAVMALSVMLHEAQGVRDAERGRDIDIGGEVVTVRTVLDEYRAALAAATERVEAAEERANVASARLVVARADYGELLAPARARLEALLYGEGQDDVPDGLDALLTAAADEIEHSRELELEATAEHEARRCLEDVERERDAAIARIEVLESELHCAKAFHDVAVAQRNAEIHRADALAARLAEVDGEHPA